MWYKTEECFRLGNETEITHVFLFTCLYITRFLYDNCDDLEKLVYCNLTTPIIIDIINENETMVFCATSNNMKLRLILTKQIASMMEEPQRRSMLYFIEGNRASEICRLVYCAKIRESSDAVLKAFNSAAKEYSSEAVTGLLLVYPQYMVHLIEAPEEEIFQLCRHFFIKCSHLIGSTKCFPVQVEVVGRFFDKWYARKASQYNLLPEKISSGKVLQDNFENASAIYRKTIVNLYQFYGDLRLLSNRNHTLMVELLESLSEDGHRLLPEGVAMEFILNSCWGQSLEELTDRFLNPISIDPNTAWPFPKVTLPRVDFKKIDELKDQLKTSAVEASATMK